MNKGEQTYLEKVYALRAEMEKEFHNRVAKGLVWDRTDIMMNQPEDPVSFQELPVFAYENDGHVDYYYLVLTDEDTVKGVMEDDHTQYYWAEVQEIDMVSLAQILDDTWLQK